VLVVCTGNTCRSPMAEHLLRARGIDASSAGTDVVPQGLMSGHALAALAQRGLDGSTHRARRLTRDLVDAADLVLVMEPAHRDAVRALAPDAAVTVLDVPDPYGGTAADYRACLAAIDAVLPGSG
jgi:protein-tyrosine phosphatase